VPVLIVKKTLLLLTVSVTGILKEVTFISPHVSFGIATESVYTMLLLQDDRTNRNVSIKTNEYLLIPLIIESSVFSFVRVGLIPAFCIGRVESGQAIILKQILGNGWSVPGVVDGLKTVCFLPFLI